MRRRSCTSDPVGMMRSPQWRMTASPSFGPIIREYIPRAPTLATFLVPAAEEHEAVAFVQGL
jgi:hypothetical protein